MNTIILHISNYLKSNIKYLKKFKELAGRFSLFLSKRDVFGNRWFGLDIMKRKLVYIQHNHIKINCMVVNLKDLKSCSLKKQYDSIEAGGLKHKKLHEYLKAICLELQFENNPKVISLTFFEKQKDKFLNLSELEAKAQEWQTTISNLILKQLPAIATV